MNPNSGTTTHDPQWEKEDRAIAAARELVTLHHEFLRKKLQVAQLFRDAGMTPLPSVAGILGQLGGTGRSLSRGDPRIIVTPPPEPPRPPEAGENWIWVQIKSLTPTSLVLAVLRKQNEPRTPIEFFPDVQHYDPNANLGSVQNIGTRFDGSVIERVDGKWRLLDRSKAPIILEDYVWGPPSIFHQTEVASYRRHLILHVLQAAPKGMQMVEVFRKLKDSGFAFVGIGKDNVKGDLESLEKDNLVRAVGHPRKWVLVKPEES